jgi:(p)ppGpp synthase/HD superfamily hydrolase
VPLVLTVSLKESPHYRDYLKMAATVEIMRAANFAAIKHRKQKRKDCEGTPYINHPIGVAHFLTEVPIATGV